DGEWLWYPRQRWYTFDVPALEGRTPWLILPYVSAVPDPMHMPGGNMVVGAGNIATIHAVSPNRWAIKNETCSDYYLQVVALVPPRAPGLDDRPEIPDAGTPDADLPDAAGEGGI